MKASSFRLLILLFFSIFFAGCQTIEEEPDVVLKKAFIEQPDRYERSIELNMKDDPEESELEWDLTLYSQVDRSDDQDIQTTHSFSAQWFFSESIGQFLPMFEFVDRFLIAVDLVRFGGEIYFKPQDINARARKNQDPKLSAMFDYYIDQIYKPYLNNAYKTSMTDLESFLEALYSTRQGFRGGKEESLFHFDEYSNYLHFEMGPDVAESGLFTVNKNFGLEEIEILSGQTVDVYHYQLALDAMGAIELGRILNEKYGYKSAIPYHIMNFVDYYNEVFYLEVWIGRDDYHFYKVNLETIDGSDLGVFVEMILESKPLNSLHISPPDESEVIELSPLLSMAQKQIESFIPYDPPVPEVDETPRLYLENGDIMTFSDGEIVTVKPDGEVVPSPVFSDEEIESMVDDILADSASDTEENSDLGVESSLSESDEQSELPTQIPDDEVPLSEQLKDMTSDPELMEDFYVDEICKKNIFNPICRESIL